MITTEQPTSSSLNLESISRWKGLLLPWMQQKLHSKQWLILFGLELYVLIGSIDFRKN